jgi:hypothetical protein
MRSATPCTRSTVRKCTDRPMELINSLSTLWYRYTPGCNPLTCFFRLRDEVNNLGDERNKE